jgi:hypothetical protein
MNEHFDENFYSLSFHSKFYLKCYFNSKTSFFFRFQNLEDGATEMTTNIFKRFFTNSSNNRCDDNRWLS